MEELPDFLASGEKARLIPVAADTSKESRAASVLLSAITSVDDFAKSLLGGIGLRIGTRANIQGYTEVVFKKSPENLKLRPDALLIVITGKRSWAALFEVKVGRAELDKDQITKYCQLAKLNGANAIITVSNQFAALPTHHPARPSKSVTRGIDLFHWSWMHVLTEAVLLLHDHEFDSPEQRYILSEVVRYLKHDSVGVSSFDRMNPEWKDLVVKVQSGAALHKSAQEVENSVAAWHQEQRDLCLLMSRKLGRHVTLKLPKAHSNDAVRRLKDDCDTVVQSQNLVCTLIVPDAAAPITVCADIGRKTIFCSMRLEAPKNKKLSRSRINWVVRQLSKADPEGVFVKAIWPGRSPDTQAPLAYLRENPELLDPDGGSHVPQYFEIIMMRDLAGKFAGSRTFIEHLESVVPDYYEQVGQHLQAWVPPPPKMVKETAEPVPEAGREKGLHEEVAQAEVARAESTQHDVIEEQPVEARTGEEKSQDNHTAKPRSSFRINPFRHLP